MVGSKEDRAGVLSVIFREWTRRQNLIYKKFHLSITKNFYTVGGQIVKHRTRFPREVVKAPSLEILIAQLEHSP